MPVIVFLVTVQTHMIVAPLESAWNALNITWKRCNQGGHDVSLLVGLRRTRA